MIDRAEIEFTMAMAQKGIRCEAPAKVMEELCRVYLAWVDAPEGRADLLGYGYLNFATLSYEAQDALDQKLVRLVVVDGLEVPDE